MMLYNIAPLSKKRRRKKKGGRGGIFKEHARPKIDDCVIVIY